MTHAPAPADEPAPPRGEEGSWPLDESVWMPLALDLGSLEFAGPVLLVFVTPVAD